MGDRPTTGRLNGRLNDWKLVALRAKTGESAALVDEDAELQLQVNGICIGGGSRHASHLLPDCTLPRHRIALTR